MSLGAVITVSRSRVGMRPERVSMLGGRGRSSFVVQKDLKRAEVVLKGVDILRTSRHIWRTLEPGTGRWDEWFRGRRHALETWLRAILARVELVELGTWPFGS